jgi:DNA-binding SARP family transcriptional activator
MARKLETLLVSLLLREKQVVSVDQLIADLWGDKPPRRATAALHVYISQLRKFLTAAGCAPNPVITRAPGYLIQIDADDLDLNVFRKLVRQGRAHRQMHRHEEASAAFQSALALWRGPALADVRHSPVVDGFVTLLEELRLECIELLVESDFALGRERELVTFLHTMIIENPLREVYYRQLMLALYRCDRRAEALEVYRRARTTFTRELGIEPGRPMRELHQAILQANDRLDIAV